MADIKIKDIKPAGAELFSDSENLMDDLNEGDLQNVIGGRTNTSAYTCTGAQGCAQTAPPPTKSVSEVIVL